MIEPDKVLPAARELIQYIRAKHGSVPAFCADSGLDRIQVQRAIRGDCQRITVDFAADIERATEGTVQWRGWITPPRVRKERKLKRSATKRIQPGKGRAA